MPRNNLGVSQDDLRAYLATRSRPGENGCHVWTGATYTSGHGKFNSRGRFMRAHRVAYEQYRGPIPSGLLVCHRCDNPPCINPEHLFLGTVADNNRDMFEKGRHAQGVKNGRSRLTPLRVQILRRAYATGKWTHQKLAAKLGLCGTAIQRAITGASWAHVSDHITSNAREG